MTARIPLSSHALSALGHQRWKLSHRVLIRRWDIVRGDTVEITSGRDAGKRGVVSEVVRRHNSVVVKGARLKKRFATATAQSSGYEYTREGLVHRSDVALIDPINDAPTRTRTAFTAAGHKLRVAVTSGAVIPKPTDLLTTATARRSVNTATDTATDAVITRTYVPPDWSAVRAFNDRIGADVAESKQKFAERQMAQSNESRRRHKRRLNPTVRPPPHFTYRRADSLIQQAHTAFATLKQTSGVPEGIQFAVKH